jgi:predicted transcriptional regulator
VRRFGELEATLMDWMWSYGRPASVRQVWEELKKQRKIAYTTVMTVLDNLHKKGWLRRQLAGRAYLYEPVASREAYSATLMRDALGTSSNYASTFVHFLSQMSPDEVAALRSALKIVPPEEKR